MTTTRVVAAVVTVLSGLTLTACGGRTALVPVHQIGRLSSDAVVAGDAGVWIVVRTAAWDGDPAVLMHLTAVEVTFDNTSARAIAITHQNVALVSDTEDRSPALSPLDVGRAAATISSHDITGKALPERVLRPGERVTGFVYFENLQALAADADDVQFRAELVDAATGERFGLIEIPFHLE